MTNYEIVQELLKNKADAEVIVVVNGKEERYIIDSIDQLGYSGSSIMITVIEE